MGRWPRHQPLILVLLLVVLAAGWLLARRGGPSAFRADPLPSGITPEFLQKFTALEARENNFNQSIWAKEMLAEQYGAVLDSLWDTLNSATNKFEVLARFDPGELLVPQFTPAQRAPDGVRIFNPGAPGRHCSTQQWREFLQNAAHAGWQIGHTEFRQVLFDPARAGAPAQSRFYFSAHLTNSSTVERAVLEGTLMVTWALGSPGGQPPSIQQIDASGLALKSRAGSPPFEIILDEQIAPPEKSYFIDPLIVYDLDSDGTPEIILASKNLVYRLRNGQYQPEPLCAYPPGLIFTAIIGDFDGDGAADFLCANFDGLLLYKGTPDGRFENPPELAWRAHPQLRYAQVLTCGDIDHDGDLDLFLGQYKVPYTRGQMPAPYYDANDGFPSYLLLNDGHGHFTDATETSGLGKKRYRRTYSASLVDLDHDGHLDLMVVSDFAGVDLYRNDGLGHFHDVTRDWITEPHGFGMGHALADFNADGLLDLLMIGMNSPTADRLNHFGLVRDRSVDEPNLRREMTFGNRLYLAKRDAGFEQTTLSSSIAHSGWSWGCSAFDFDNDGFPDVYIANGLETKESVREYEPEFWLHDIYVGNSQDNLLASAYFTAQSSRTRGRGWSYGGRESNRLFLNQQGHAFLEAGHLMGVALETDSRAVVASDLDSDGQLDLLVTTFEAWPELKQTLRIYRNHFENPGHWIGFRFREQPGSPSPAGASVTIQYRDHSATRQIVTGDSYRSQHDNSIHFGLGHEPQVDLAKITWPGGQSLTLHHPKIDQYHRVTAPRYRPGHNPTGRSIQR